MKAHSTPRTTYGMRLSAFIDTFDVGEFILILIFAGLAVGALLEPIVIAGVPIFATETFLFLLFAHTSLKQMWFVLLLFAIGCSLVLPFHFSPIAQILTATIQAISIRFVTKKSASGTVTEGIIFAYFAIIPVMFCALYLTNNDVQLSSLQMARKVMECLVCIFLFHVIDKAAIYINAYYDRLLPLFPSKISTKEFAQSMMAIGLTGIILLITTVELEELNDSWGSAMYNSIEAIQTEHSGVMRQRIAPLISVQGPMSTAPGPLSNNEKQNMYAEAGIISARFIPISADSKIEDLGKDYTETLNILAKLRRSSSAFAVIQPNDTNGERWDFLTSYGPSGILVLSFKSEEDFSSFFSTENTQVSLSKEGYVKHGRSESLEDALTKNPGLKEITLFENDSMSLWVRSDLFIHNHMLLSALADGQAHLTFSSVSALSPAGIEWTFITTADAWPYVFQHYAPFLLTTRWGFLALSLFIISLGFLVHRALDPARILSRDYSNYIISLMGLDTNAELPKTRTTLIEETGDVQDTLLALTQEIQAMNIAMQETLGSYQYFFDEMPVGVMGIDETGKRSYINESLSKICRLSSVALNDIQNQAMTLFDNHNTTAIDIEVVCGDGNPHRLDLYTVDRLGEKGLKKGIWVIIADRTEEKLKDKQLAQASKLATLGQMSTEIAHELNQPLNVVSLCQATIVAEIQKSDTDKEKVLKKTTRIKSAVDRASRIINHMRVYGRVDAGKLELIDARLAIQGALTMTEDQLKILGLMVWTEIPDDHLLVMSDTTKLEQVIINLISNARDATIENAERPEIWLKAEAKSGQVRIVVQDNGGGVKEEDLFKIFEPFWTTKLSGEGTGLGGSISYGVIKEMGGTIVADNVQDGLRVTITLKQFRGESALSKSAIV